MAFPYVKANNPWRDANSATGGGNETTPLTAADLDQIEAGIASLSDILALVSAKGDLLVATANDAFARLGVGADNQVLTADSAQTSGVKWANAAASVSAATATILVPIHLNTPAISNSAGNAFPTVLGLTAWDAWHWQFVKDVVGDVFGTVRIPNDLAGTPNAKIVLELAANATTGVSTMGVASTAVADGVTLNPASLTAETDQDITVPATAYLRKKVSFTLTNAPAADSLLIVRVRHNGTAVNDTLAVNTLLFGAWLQCDVSRRLV